MIVPKIFPARPVCIFLMDLCSSPGGRLGDMDPAHSNSFQTITVLKGLLSVQISSCFCSSSLFVLCYIFAFCVFLYLYWTVKCNSIHT